jgi:hypothetical protein
MRKILLIFGDHKKLATIGPPSATEPDKDLLLERARNLFLDGNGEAKVIIQEYVVDFEDWIDIENDFVAEDKQKIKVILSKLPELPHSPCQNTPGPVNAESITESPILACQPQETSLVGSSSMEMPPHASSTPLAQSSLIAYDDVSSQSPATLSTAMQMPAEQSPPKQGPVMEVESIRNKTKSQSQYKAPLPRPFNLPQNFSPLVNSGLQAGSLSGKALTKFITEVAASVYSYKSYPTSEEKHHVALQCIRKYPFLESSCGTGFGYLVVGLTERLKYLRRPYKRPQPPSPYSANSIPHPLAKKPPKDARPLVMPHPCIVVGEDEEAHSRNVKMLQSLSRQQNPDPSAVQDLMKRTFAFRRLKLEDTATLYTICSFLDTYPFLRKETEVRK